MGKKKGIRPKKPALQNAASSDEEETALDAILDDEIGRYNAEKEDTLLKKSKKSKTKKVDDSEGEEEVFGLNLDVSESEDEEGEEASDIGGAMEDSDNNLDDDNDEEEDSDNDEDIYGNDNETHGIPNERAWGKRAKVFHSTDYVDQDFGGMEGEDAEQAELEEEEALKIQKQLTAEMDEADFMDFIPAASTQQKQTKNVDTLEPFKLDVSKLAPSEIKKLTEKHCPEVEFLLKDCGDKLAEAQKLTAVVAKKKLGGVSKQYYSTRIHALQNYCINVIFFLHLRGSNPQEAAGHPVVKKIMQYRRLLSELDQIDSKKLEKHASSLDTLDHQEGRDSIKAMQQPKEGEDLNLDEVAESDDEDPEGRKRKITYAMEKNKGLQPKRSKEQRNPRVKHREKYRKAKIRRKGQVQNVRKETTRYDGEIFGIKSNLAKSVKFK